MPDLRFLPSVEQLLQTQTAAELIAIYGRPLTLNAIRSVIADIRANASSEKTNTLPDRETLLERVGYRLQDWVAPSLLSVINASGVILHTNLGRAPLSTKTIQAMEAVARGYSNLEYELRKGQRGSRLMHAESILHRLTGAEAAIVVNNNAAGVLLALSALASRKRVVIARSQLVEIGGGFRVPDVMKQSGAKLVEVGTTNKVRLADYEDALQEPVGLVMRAHHSNFKIVGFTEEPEFREIVELAHHYKVPFLDDLGSGSLLKTERFGLAHEPTVQESIEAGADLICFSGDKLLGGPQAGIILGQADLMTKIKKHPLARAVRADKLCLAGISTTLLHYLKDEAEREIPVWRMIATTPEQLKARATGWSKALGKGEVVSSESTIGGGSLPGETLPTWVLTLTTPSPDKFLKRMRLQQPPIIARVENERILLDPRTVLPEQEGALLVVLQNLLRE